MANNEEFPPLLNQPDLTVDPDRVLTNLIMNTANLDEVDGTTTPSFVATSVDTSYHTNGTSTSPVNYPWYEVLTGVLDHK